MDIQFDQIFTRPSTSVPWFHETWDPAHPLYVKTTYIDTGLVVVDKALSVDELTLSIVYSFLDVDAYNLWSNDQHMIDMGALKVAYNTANNITQVK